VGGLCLFRGRLPNLIGEMRRNCLVM
jgi:hypothetical protein